MKVVEHVNIWQFRLLVSAFWSPPKPTFSTCILVFQDFRNFPKTTLIFNMKRNKNRYTLIHKTQLSKSIIKLDSFSFLFCPTRWAGWASHGNGGETGKHRCYQEVDKLREFSESIWRLHSLDLGGSVLLHSTLAIPALGYLRVIFQHVGNELGTLPSIQTIKSSKT